MHMVHHDFTDAFRTTLTAMVGVQGRFDEVKSVLQQHRDSADVEDERLSMRGNLEDESTPPPQHLQ